jgi:aerobic carbon-monoxide dehydrogenase small subunit
MIQISYTLRINGTERDVEDAWFGENLLYVLRERLGFQGAKSACEQGECGSCSVLLDGSIVCACLVLAASAEGGNITTLEGLQPADRRQLSPIQRAFVEEGAVQCGFCTPGLVVAVTKLLEDYPDPTHMEIREAISGNLCRCTGYGRILAAVRAAVGAMRD